MGEGQHDGAGPARTFATVAGGGLILVGLAGFFYSSSFATGESLTAEKEFGLFYVNGWMNLLHLAAGMLGLALAVRGARLYCLGAGLVWMALAGGGFFGAHGGEAVPAMGGLIPAGTANNLLNLILAGLGLAAAAATAASRSVEPGRLRTIEKQNETTSKSRQKAEKRSKPNPRLEPDTSGIPVTPGVGRPRSAGRVKRSGRGPIN